MDYLYNILDSIDRADKKEDIKLLSIMAQYSLSNADRKQEEKIIEYVKKLNNKIKSIQSTVSNTKYEKKEKDNQLADCYKYYGYFIKKLDVKPETMYSMIFHILKKGNTEILTNCLNVLYRQNQETFLELFKK